MRAHRLRPARSATCPERSGLRPALGRAGGRQRRGHPDPLHGDGVGGPGPGRGDRPRRAARGGRPRRRARHRRPGAARAARLVPGTRPSGIFTTGQLQQWVHRQRLPLSRAGAHCGRRARLVLRGADPARSGCPPGRAGHRPAAHADVPPLRPRDPRRPPRPGLDRDIRHRRVTDATGWTGCSSAAPMAPNARWPSTSSSSPGTSSPTTSWPAWPHLAIDPGTKRSRVRRRRRDERARDLRHRQPRPPRRDGGRGGAARACRSAAPPPRGCATVTAARPGPRRSACASPTRCSGLCRTWPNRAAPGPSPCSSGPGSFWTARASR